MDFLFDFLTRFVAQLQSPTLGFLIGGIVVAAVNSRLTIPDAIYRFVVFMLLITVGLEAGMAISEANLAEMLLPALFAVAIGIIVVFIGRNTLVRLPNIKAVDAIATVGLFGAVSGSTLAAAIELLQEQGIQYEAWASALYPFMDIPALVTAIVLASIYTSKQRDTAGEYHSKQRVTAGGDPSEQRITASGYPKEQGDTEDEQVKIWPIVKESLQGAALSALLLGIALGLLIQPEGVIESFYGALFNGFLSILMLVLGMEATARLSELRKVAQWYVVYALVTPLLNGLIGFGFGMIAHYTTGFSPGGVVLLAAIAGSNSDISGPPTLRAGIPSANPSAYIGSSTAIGTPIAIAVGIPLYIALAEALMGS